jgi:hypothetical protein
MSCLTTFGKSRDLDNHAAGQVSMIDYCPPQRNAKIPFSSASTVFDDIKQHLQDIRYTIKDDEDMVAIVPLADGTIVTMALLGYRNPNFIIVDGPDNHGNRTHALIPHLLVQVL